MQKQQNPVGDILSRPGNGTDDQIQIQKIGGNDWVQAAEKAYELQQLAKKYNDLKREAMNTLQSISKYRSKIDGGFCFELSHRKGSVNYKNIPQLKYVDLDEYRGNDVDIWKLIKITNG